MASRYAWLLVDEFQDTSAEQVEIFRQVAAYGQTRFFIVGDLNQAIMSFAGASPRLMGMFAEAIGARRDVRLHGNYRCSARIIAHAERLWSSAKPMEALGASRDHETDPSYIHTSTIETGIREHFLPTLEAHAIGLGEAAVLAPWWIPLFNLARILRVQGLPIVGPGARPYKRKHAFALLAENLAAHVGGGSAQSFARLQRALLLTVRELTGEMDWRVYSYSGRVLLCDLVYQVRSAPPECSSWITMGATVAADLLMGQEMLSSSQGAALRSSAGAMLVEMAAQGVDPAATTMDAIGMFAQPEKALHLLTMHKAKGQEFDAVAIIDLHDDRVPDYRATTEAEIAEARRLLYVAVTRARKILMYFTDSSHWKNRPSRFLGRGALELL